MRISFPSAFLFTSTLAQPALAFVPIIKTGWQQLLTPSPLRTTTTTTQVYSSVPSDVAEPFSSTIDALKADLVRACTRASSTSGGNGGAASADEIKRLVQELEDMGEQLGIGQASSLTGYLSGEWELIWAPTDITRSSPFFWAFEQAFPDQADQIFGITDSIPAPLKEVGPATQIIELSEGGTSGRLVSRVRVATLNGMATSMMTTRAEITGTIGVDGLKVRIDTTKPEDSTLVTTLLPGPLGALVNDNLPPFPSGQALERAMPGSSTVIMRTTYCDDGLRISRNDARYNEPFIWRRLKFLRVEDL